MVYQFEIFPVSRLIKEVWTGEVRLVNLVNGLREIEQHPDFDPSFAVIADYSSALLELTADDLLRYQTEVRKRNWPEQGRRVMIAPNDLEYGTGLQAKALWKFDGLHVFRTEEEALASLGID